MTIRRKGKLVNSNQEKNKKKKRFIPLFNVFFFCFQKQLAFFLCQEAIKGRSLSLIIHLGISCRLCDFLFLMLSQSKDADGSMSSRSWPIFQRQNGVGWLCCVVLWWLQGSWSPIEMKVSRSPESQRGKSNVLLAPTVCKFKDYLSLVVTPQLLALYRPVVVRSASDACFHIQFPYFEASGHVDIPFCQFMID